MKNLHHLLLASSGTLAVFTATSLMLLTTVGFVTLTDVCLVSIFDDLMHTLGDSLVIVVETLARTIGLLLSLLYLVLSF